MTSVIEEHNSTSCKWLVYQLQVIFPLISYCIQQCFITSYALHASTLLSTLQLAIIHHLSCLSGMGGKGYYCAQQLHLGDSRQVKVIKSSYLVKGQRKFILVVKSQSKYLAGQHFDRGRRSEYRIYRSVTPLIVWSINSPNFLSPKARKESIHQTFLLYDNTYRVLLYS